MIRKAAAVLAVLAAFAMALVGCGGDSDTSSEVLTYKPWNLPGTAEPAERTVEEFLKPGKNGLVGSEPKAVIPDRPPPEFLVSVNLIDSFSPATASDGDQLTVQYVGFDYDSKEKFASSWDEGKPLTFTMGKGEVIEGWEQGLRRMEIGDRIELVVPAEMATGGSQPKGIPKDSAVVFVVECLALKDTG